MYRYRRRRKLQRRRRATVVAVSAAVLAFVVGIPTLAAADPVNDVLNNLGLGSGSGDGSTSGGGSVTPSAGTPPSYTPPLHGTNPHGQGSAAVVDLNPSDTNPYPGQPDGSEELIVGDSRGEQTSDGSYHGNVALAYLFGNAILGIETAPGESEDGPLQPIQDGLDQLCDQSNGQICVSLLEMHSSTTANSSTNSFRAVGAHVGGEEGINADVATSNGNISSDGTCQTAHGDSSVADASVGGALFADAAQGSSTSTSCNNGTQSVDQKSTVIGIGGVDPPPGVPLPTAGCENGTPNTNFTALAPILGAVCNADDTNGSQTSAPYGVREALTLFALITDGSSVLKATAAGPESHAVAPAAQVTTPPTGPGTTAPGGGTKGAGGTGGGGAGGAGGGAGGAGDGGAGAGAAAGAAAAGDGQLAFTGADLLALGMVGGALILGGLALTATAGRRHRQTV